jgi:hypothetical protein
MPGKDHGTFAVAAGTEDDALSRGRISPGSLADS